MLRLPKGLREQLQQHAASRGESLNGFINRAIMQAVEADAAQDPQTTETE